MALLKTNRYSVPVTNDQVPEAAVIEPPANPINCCSRYSPSGPMYAVSEDPFQTPSIPFPVAAVEPTCGDASDGNVSLIPPDDELLDEEEELLDELLDDEELLEDDELVASGAGEELPPPPPPPPHALSRLNKNKQGMDSLQFILKISFEDATKAGIKPSTSLLAM